MFAHNSIGVLIPGVTRDIARLSHSSTCLIGFVVAGNSLRSVIGRPDGPREIVSCFPSTTTGIGMDRCSLSVRSSSHPSR
jgi:hypothetical protein